jgi:hypothetical protein
MAIEAALARALPLFLALTFSQPRKGYSAIYSSQMEDFHAIFGVTMSVTLRGYKHLNNGLRRATKERQRSLPSHGRSHWVRYSAECRRGGSRLRCDCNCDRWPCSVTLRSATERSTKLHLGQYLNPCGASNY